MLTFSRVLSIFYGVISLKLLNHKLLIILILMLRQRENILLLNLCIGLVFNWTKFVHECFIKGIIINFKNYLT
jgi:hypothetical protein